LTTVSWYNCSTFEIILFKYFQQLDTKQCKDNEWNTDLNTIKGYTLSTDLFQLNARQSDIGLSTTHARISVRSFFNLL